MAIKSRAALKALLETGDLLSQATFIDVVDSVYINENVAGTATDGETKIDQIHPKTDTKVNVDGVYHKDAAISCGQSTYIKFLQTSFSSWNTTAAPLTLIVNGLTRDNFRGVHLIMKEAGGSATTHVNVNGVLIQCDTNGEIRLTRVSGGQFDVSGFDSSDGKVTVYFDPTA